MLWSSDKSATAAAAESTQPNYLAETKHRHFLYYCFSLFLFFVSLLGRQVQLAAVAASCVMSPLK